MSHVHASPVTGYPYVSSVPELKLPSGSSSTTGPEQPDRTYIVKIIKEQQSRQRYRTKRAIIPCITALAGAKLIQTIAGTMDTIRRTRDYEGSETGCQTLMRNWTTGVLFGRTRVVSYAWVP
jgi:hypothetical protein